MVPLTASFLPFLRYRSRFYLIVSLAVFNTSVTKRKTRHFFYTSSPDFSCSQGQYMDMATQACTPCPVGTYSLGRAVRYENWHGKLPAGFTVRDVDGRQEVTKMSAELMREAGEVKVGAQQLSDFLNDVGEDSRRRHRREGQSSRYDYNCTG